jgi:predicted nucleic acid-binding protein
MGGYSDVEFETATEQLFERIKNKEFDVYFSEVNDEELLFAPLHIKAVKNQIPSDCFHYIEITEDAEKLAQLYILEGALNEESKNDAFHIALASLNRVDCLISWNFKHIVNFNKIKTFNSINMRYGYPLIDIRSPLEFLKI